MAQQDVRYYLNGLYLEILGGYTSQMFLYFKSLLIRGFMAVKKHLDELITLISIMSVIRQPSADIK